MDRRGNERVRRLRASSIEVSGDGDKSLVVFDNPRDIAGTAVLTFAHAPGADDQWLYLPALKRVKRIAAANQSGPFMGSEFAYEDLAGEELGKFTYRWLSDEPCPAPTDLTCFVVERRPTAEQSGYSHQVVWFDQEAYRPWKIDYYDRRRESLKTLTYGGYQQYLDRYWRAHEMIMVNGRTGRTTRLGWREIQYQTGLTEADFTTASLRSGPFMGSEFAYEDLAGEELGKFTYRWLSDEPCPAPTDLTCFVVERRPTAEQSGYSHQVVWFDQEAYRPWKIDYYDRRRESLKTLTYGGYQQYLDRYWRAHEMIMVNGRTGRTTRLGWREIQYQTGLTEADFTTASLRRSR